MTKPEVGQALKRNKADTIDMRHITAWNLHCNFLSGALLLIRRLLIKLLIINSKTFACFRQRLFVDPRGKSYHSACTLASSWRVFM